MLEKDTLCVMHQTLFKIQMKGRAMTGGWKPMITLIHSLIQHFWEDQLDRIYTSALKEVKVTTVSLSTLLVEIEEV